MTIHAFVKKPQTLIALLVAVVVILLMLVIFPKKIDQNKQNSDTTGNLSSRKSQLIGSVVSRKNLSGLTLRINQVLACNGRLSIFVSASNDSGSSVNNLNKNDIKLSIDNKKSDSFSFDAGSKKSFPLSSSLVIDKSGSMAGQPIEDAKLAAKAYVRTVNETEKISIITFNQTVETLVSLSNDKPRIESVIDSISAQGDTSVYDALSKAVTENAGCSRKAIIVLSDGDDTSSINANVESVIREANQENVPVFSVGLKGEGFNPTPIQSISDKTGGQYLEAPNSDNISELYEKFIEQLDNQYIIQVDLKDNANSAEHRIKVEALISGSSSSSERSIIY